MKGERAERTGVRTSIMHLHSFGLGYVNQHIRPLLHDKDVVLSQNVKSGRHVAIRKDCGRERTSHFEPGYRDAEAPATEASVIALRPAMTWRHTGVGEGARHLRGTVGEGAAAQATRDSITLLAAGDTWSGIKEFSAQEPLAEPLSPRLDCRWKRM